MKCPSQLFNTFRPDIVVKTPNGITVIELTIPFETNLIKSREEKKKKNKKLKEQLKVPCSNFQTFLFEVSSLGFISKEAKTIKNYFKGLRINTDVLFSKCMEVAIRCTYYIYCRRNKEWTNPALIDYN